MKFTLSQLNFLLLFVIKTFNLVRLLVLPNLWCSLGMSASLIYCPHSVYEGWRVSARQGCQGRWLNIRAQFYSQPLQIPTSANKFAILLNWVLHTITTNSNYSVARYGYRPIPSEIDTAELGILREALVSMGNDVHLIDKWYRKDHNKVWSCLKIDKYWLDYCIDPIHNYAIATNLDLYYVCIQYPENTPAISWHNQASLSKIIPDQPQMECY